MTATKKRRLNFRRKELWKRRRKARRQKGMKDYSLKLSRKAMGRISLKKETSYPCITQEHLPTARNLTLAVIVELRLNSRLELEKSFAPGTKEF